MDNSGTYRCTDNQLNPIIHFIFRLTDSIKVYTCIVSKWVLVFFFFFLIIRFSRDGKIEF